MMHIDRALILKVSGGLGLALMLVGWTQRDNLPTPGRVNSDLLVEPIQAPLGADVPAEWQVNEKGTVYTIKPLYEYHLQGMVVSERDTRVWWNYVHRSWGDFFNVKDICVIWGENVTSGVYQKMKFTSGSFTCYCQMKRGQGQYWREFRMHQLSNNHLLPSNPQIRNTILSTKRGDQVRLSGYLVEYSHGGGFRRGTSTTRTDTGDGACETIYVTGYEIVAAANRVWHFAYGAGWLLVIFTVVAGVVGFFWDVHRKFHGLQHIEAEHLDLRSSI